MIADHFTKPLGMVNLEYFRDKLGVRRPGGLEAQGRTTNGADNNGIHEDMRCQPSAYMVCTLKNKVRHQLGSSCMMTPA